VQPSNDFQAEILKLHLLTTQPKTDALRDRLHALLDDLRPTYFSVFVVLMEQCVELLAATPDECRETLAGWMVDVVTERADCPR
jgi:hypothetical protein